MDAGVSVDVDSARSIELVPPADKNASGVNLSEAPLDTPLEGPLNAPLEATLEAPLDLGEITSDDTGIQDLTASKFSPGTKTISSLIHERDLVAGIQLDAELVESIDTRDKAKYRVGEQIARGGMGAILDAKDVNLRRRIAMKVMHDPDQVSDRQLARFIEEAQVTGQLQHPSIVPVYELGVDADNRPFYTMKLLKGRSLEEILDAIENGDEEVRETWTLPALLNAFSKICEAISYAHSKDVIHRDLKPENVMIGQFGEVQVLDWGLAKVLTAEAEAPVEVLDAEPMVSGIIESVRSGDSSGRFQSMDGSVAGTPTYMAPEQAEGLVDQIDERTDVYGLGGILYAILTFRSPVTAPNLQLILAKVRAGAIVAPDQLEGFEPPHLPGQRVPASLNAITMKALALRPEDRYDDVASLLADVQSFQSGFATHAEEAGRLKRVGLFLKRNKLAAVFSTLLLAAILAGSVMSLLQRNQAVAALGLAKQEETKRLDSEKSSATSILKAARTMIGDGDYDNAAKALDRVKVYNPSLACAYDQALLATRLGALTNGAARSEAYEQAKEFLSSEPDLAGDASAKTLGDLLTMGLEQTQIEFPAKTFARLADGAGFRLLATEFEQDAETQLSRYQAMIEEAWPGQGAGLTRTSTGKLEFTQVSDKPYLGNLEVFKGMPLTRLVIVHPHFASFEPLTGMPLESIIIGHRGKVGAELIQTFRGLEDSPIRSAQFSSFNHLKTTAALSHLQQVKSLELFNSRLPDLPDLSACRQLDDFHLHYCGFQNGKPREFSSLPMHARSLRFPASGIVISDPEDASLFTGTHFMPFQTPLADLKLLSRMPNLEFVGAYGNPLALPGLLDEPVRMTLSGRNQQALAMVDELEASLPEKRWTLDVHKLFLLYRALLVGDRESVSGHIPFLKSFAGYEYFLLPSRLTQGDSMQLAEQLGGRLVVIESREELGFLRRNFGSADYWLGASPNWNTTSFEWINGAHWDENLFPNLELKPRAKPYMQYAGPTCTFEATAKYYTLIEWEGDASKRVEPTNRSPDELTHLIERYLPIDPEPHLGNTNLTSVNISNPQGVQAMIYRYLNPSIDPEVSLGVLKEKITAPGFAPLAQELEFLIRASKGEVNFDLLEGPSIAIPRYDGKAYFYSTSMKSWPAAQQEAEWLGGHLATLTSKAENDFVVSFLPKIRGYHQIIWLGGSRKTPDDSWVWSTDEPFIFANWNSNSPKMGSHAKSLGLYGGGQWENLGPDQTRPSLIEWTPGEPIHLTEKTISPVQALHHALIQDRKTRDAQLDLLKRHADSTIQKEVGHIQRLLDSGKPPSSFESSSLHWEEREGTTYLYWPENLSRSKAQQLAKTIGAQLIQLETEKEWSWVTDTFIRPYKEATIHIDGTVENGVARYSDGRPFSFAPWGNEEPNDSGPLAVLIGSVHASEDLNPGDLDDCYEWLMCHAILEWPR